MEDCYHTWVKLLQIWLSGIKNIVLGYVFLCVL